MIWPPLQLDPSESLHREHATGEIVVIRRTQQWKPYTHCVVVRRASGVEHIIPRAHVELYFDRSLKLDEPKHQDSRPLPVQLEALSKLLGDSDD